MSARVAGRVRDDDRTLLQVRLPKELVKRLDHFCIDRDVFRAKGCEILLTEGLKAMGVDG